MLLGGDLEGSGEVAVIAIDHITIDHITDVDSSGSRGLIVCTPGLVATNSILFQWLFITV